MVESCTPLVGSITAEVSSGRGDRLLMVMPGAAVRAILGLRGTRQVEAGWRATNALPRARDVCVQGDMSDDATGMTSRHPSGWEGAGSTVMRSREREATRGKPMNPPAPPEILRKMTHFFNRGNAANGGDGEESHRLD